MVMGAAAGTEPAAGVVAAMVTAVLTGVKRGWVA
jgi:hypothetical protein